MPRPRAYAVRLSAADRAELIKVVSTGTHPAGMITRARVLLDVDESSGPVSTREVIAERAGVSTQTVRQIVKRLADSGGDVWTTISRKPRTTPPVPPVVTGEVEAG